MIYFNHYMKRIFTNFDTHTGFTLIEFIVIMMIFAVMVGVALFNFNGFRSAVTLDNLAHDIGISIRQIQSSAGSALSGENDGINEAPRGIYFGPDGNGAFAKEFTLFEDKEIRNGIYDTGEKIDTIEIKTADSIIGIDYIDQNSVDPISINPKGGIGITFKRYKTDAMFYTAEGILNASAVKIKIAAPASGGTGDGRTRTITVSRIGQVSIQ